MRARSARSPVRRLYDALCDLMGEDELHVNLNTLPEYASLEGDREPRFCEWAYDALSRRSLAADLRRCALRPTDIMKLASASSIHPSPSHEVMLREVLVTLGVKEPAIPAPLASGVAILERFREWSDSEIEGRKLERLEPDAFSRNPVASSRRAMERLLKVIAVFLHDGGMGALVQDVWVNGRYDFLPREPVRDLATALLDVELGPLNFLLRATSRAVHEKRVQVPFLGRDEELWSQAVFESVKAVAASLNDEVHDRTLARDQSPMDRLKRQRKAVHNVLCKVHSKELRVPRLVQFFRRYTDGHAVHFEGFADDGTLVRCFETMEYELHHPYLMCSATNPASVDMICAPLREWFGKEV